MTKIALVHDKKRPLSGRCRSSDRLNSAGHLELRSGLCCRNGRHHLVERLQVRSGTGLDDVGADTFPVEFAAPRHDLDRHLAEGVLSARDAPHLEILELGRDPQNAFHRTKDRVDWSIARGGVAELFSLALQFQRGCRNGSRTGRRVETDQAPLLGRRPRNRFSIKATISAS